MTKYVLDTCICSYLIKRTPGISSRIEQNIIEHSLDTICVTIFNHAELFTGVELRNSPKLKRAVEDLIERLEIIPFEKAASQKYAEIRSLLQKNGKIISDMDMLIAACTMVENAVLVTNNEKHFTHIDGLNIQNWASSIISL